MTIQRMGTTAAIRSMIKVKVQAGVTPQELVDTFSNINSAAVMASGVAAAKELGIYVEPVDHVPSAAVKSKRQPRL